MKPIESIAFRIRNYFACFVLTIGVVRVDIAAVARLVGGVPVHECDAPRRAGVLRRAVGAPADQLVAGVYAFCVHRLLLESFEVEINTSKIKVSGGHSQTDCTPDTINQCV